jgi:hypothetical protein
MATKRSNSKARAAFIETMDCLPVATVPEGPEWTYEIKLYRLATGVWTWSFAGKTCDESVPRPTTVNRHAEMPSSKLSFRVRFDEQGWEVIY